MRTFPKLRWITRSGLVSFPRWQGSCGIVPNGPGRSVVSFNIHHGSHTAEYYILLAISQRKHLISLTHLTSIIFDLTSFNRATYLKLNHFFPMLTPHTHWKQLKTRSSHVCKRYKVKLVGKKIKNVFKFKFLELKPLRIYHQPLRKHYGLLMLSGGQERSWWYAIA